MNPETPAPDVFGFEIQIVALLSGSFQLETQLRRVLLAWILEHVGACAQLQVFPSAFWQLVFRFHGAAAVAISKLDLLALLDEQASKKSLLSDQWIF